MVWSDLKNIILVVLAVVVIVLVVRNPSEAASKTAKSCFLVQGKCVDTGEACPTDYFVNTDYYCVGETRTCCVSSTLLGQEPTEVEKGRQPTPTELGEGGIAQAEALKGEGKFEEANAAYKTIIESSAATVEDKVKAAFMAGLLYLRIQDGITTYADGAPDADETVGQLCENFRAIREQYSTIEMDNENLIFLGATSDGDDTPTYADGAQCILESINALNIEGITPEAQSRSFCMYPVPSKKEECKAKFPALKYEFEEEQPVADAEESPEDIFALYKQAKELVRTSGAYEDMCGYALSLIENYYDSCVELSYGDIGPLYRTGDYVIYGEIVSCELHQLISETSPEILTQQMNPLADCITGLDRARGYGFTAEACQNPVSTTRVCPSDDTPVS